MKMEDIITIVLLINGYRYSGKLINEDEEFITIVDSKTNSQMTFPKKLVMITRGVL
jgi:hypothetical protein